MDRGEKPFISAVGCAERAEVVARRPQDRVRQHADRSQLHHGLRRRDQDGEVHVAERRLRHEPALDGRQQERSSSCGGPGCRSGSRRSRAAAASAFRTVRRFSPMPPPDAAARPRRPRRKAISRADDRRRFPRPRREHPGPDAGDVQGRLQPLGLEGRRVEPATRSRSGTTSRTIGCSTNFTNLRLAGDHLIVPFNVGGGGRGGRGAQITAPPAGPGRRVGALLLDRPRDAERDSRCC